MDDLRTGEWVRSERRRAGLRQADLGALAGVSASTVSRFENGRVLELTFVRLARLLLPSESSCRSRHGREEERQSIGRSTGGTLPWSKPQ